MRKIFSIQSKGEGYSADVFIADDGSRSFTGDFDVDIDGSPRWHIDPDGQADTSLHFNGKPLNADEIPFIVLPPECITEPHEIVLGCKAEVRFNGRLSEAVVGDVGPHNKLGEGSPKLANNLQINPDPNNGGIDEPSVTFTYWPGTPAAFDGKQFELLSWRDLILGRRG